MPPTLLPHRHAPLLWLSCLEVATKECLARFPFVAPKTEGLGKLREKGGRPCLEWHAALLLKVRRMQGQWDWDWGKGYNSGYNYNGGYNSGYGGGYGYKGYDYDASYGAYSQGSLDGPPHPLLRAKDLAAQETTAKEATTAMRRATRKVSARRAKGRRRSRTRERQRRSKAWSGGLEKVYNIN